jgi:hypothetical protein
VQEELIKLTKILNIGEMSRSATPKRPQDHRWWNGPASSPMRGTKLYMSFRGVSWSLPISLLLPSHSYSRDVMEERANRGGKQDDGHGIFFDIFGAKHKEHTCSWISGSICGSVDKWQLIHSIISNELHRYLIALYSRNLSRIICVNLLWMTHINAW